MNNIFGDWESFKKYEHELSKLSTAVEAHKWAIDNNVDTLLILDIWCILNENEGN